MRKSRTPGLNPDATNKAIFECLCEDGLLCPGVKEEDVAYTLTVTFTDWINRNIQENGLTFIEDYGNGDKGDKRTENRNSSFLSRLFKLS